MQFQTKHAKVTGSRLRTLGTGAALSASLLAVAPATVKAQTAQDPLLDLMIQKGIVTKEEADQVRAEAEAMHTNATAVPPGAFKWKISDGIKSVELFGDLRFRYEYRSAQAPTDDRVTLRRNRYAIRLGLRGDLADNFYYGLRLETSANPRSPWATFGNSSSGVPYQGPYGKSTGTIYLGQIYTGWRPEPWLDMTIGRMPQPLYTTPMVWDSDYNPEGLAEHLKYTVGDADFFANFGQFLYQEIDPSSSSAGLGFNSGTEQNPSDVLQFAWQAGLTYHIATNFSAKAAGTLYAYQGAKQSTLTSGSSTSPYFGDPFVGEGQYTGLGSPNPFNGASGYGTSSTLPGNSSLGFPNNQVGLNNLLVLEVPFEINYSFSKFDTRLFGDFGYNFEGKERADAAAAGYQAYLQNVSAGGGGAVTLTPFSPQENQRKAYQIGFAIGSTGNLGLVYGQNLRKNAWEFRTYWQHVEQYALDANLLDSDFFEGRGNLEGEYVAFAYGLSGNIIATVRGGYAQRIDDAIGTGGSNQDIPQVNPISHYQILQMDLTYRF
jgi:hypothetical protein